MFSGTFKVIVLVGLASVVTSQLPHARDVLIQSPQNASLCVRTKAFEWEGAQMTLLDCERAYQFYDGQKYHAIAKYDGFEGLKFDTQWAPCPECFGLSGCFVPLDGKITAISCYDNLPGEFWDITELNSDGLLYQIRGKITGKCIGVPEVIDEAKLVEVECDATDPLQQWKFTIRTQP